MDFQRHGTCSTFSIPAMFEGVPTSYCLHSKHFSVQGLARGRTLQHTCRGRQRLCRGTNQQNRRVLKIWYISIAQQHHTSTSRSILGCTSLPISHKQRIAPFPSSGALPCRAAQLLCWLCVLALALPYTRLPPPPANLQLFSPPPPHPPPLHFLNFLLFRPLPFFFCYFLHLGEQPAPLLRPQTPR